jgi:hypothetical protein
MEARILVGGRAAQDCVAQPGTGTGREVNERPESPHWTCPACDSLSAQWFMRNPQPEIPPPIAVPNRQIYAQMMAHLTTQLAIHSRQEPLATVRPTGSVTLRDSQSRAKSAAVDSWSYVQINRPLTLRTARITLLTDDPVMLGRAAPFRYRGDVAGIVHGLPEGWDGVACLLYRAECLARLLHCHRFDGEPLPEPQVGSTEHPSACRREPILCHIAGSTCSDGPCEVSPVSSTSSYWSRAEI